MSFIQSSPLASLHHRNGPAMNMHRERLVRPISIGMIGDGVSGLISNAFCMRLFPGDFVVLGVNTSTWRPLCDGRDRDGLSAIALESTPCLDAAEKISL